MLLALLLLAAAPVTDDVAGAPAPAPRLEPVEPRGKVPARWYLDDDVLRVTRHAQRLFEQSASGPQGDAVGTACELTMPSSFHFAHAVLSSKELPFKVIGADLLYAPRVLKQPVQVTVWRNNAAGKDVVGEVMLGIFTLGLSTLRLVPSVFTQVSAPPNGAGRNGGFSLKCRTVGADTVRAVRDEKAATCGTYSCLAAEVSLVGTDDAQLTSRAQEIADETMRTLAQWRAQATWNLRSFEVLRAARCGSDCVKLAVRNTTQHPLDFPRLDTAIDALGRRAHVFADAGAEIAPGETRLLKVTVSLSDGPLGAQPSFPLVVRTYGNRWVQEVPGSFTEGGIEYRFTESRCENGKVVLPVTMRCLAGSGSNGADVGWTKNDRSISVHVPWCRPGEVTSEPAWAWADSGQECSRVIAVSGGSTEPAYLLLP